MVKKTKKKFLTKSYTVMLVIFATSMLFAIYAVNNMKNLRTTESHSKYATHIISGQVTRKDTSCKQEELQPDGSVKTVGNWCDGGNFLHVNGKSIFTGGGCLCAMEEPYYIADISGIDVGDYVEIRYVVDVERRTISRYDKITKVKKPIEIVVESERATCASCYVKKTGSLTGQPLKIYGIQNQDNAEVVRKSAESDTKTSDIYGGGLVYTLVAMVVVGLMSLFIAYYVVKGLRGLKQQKKRKMRVLFTIPLLNIKVRDVGVQGRIAFVLILFTVVIMFAITKTSNPASWHYSLSGSYPVNFILCGGAPVEYIDRGYERIYRLPSDEGYGIHLESNYSYCNDDYLKNAALGIYRDLLTAAGKAEKKARDEKKAAEEDSLEAERKAEQKRLWSKINYDVLVPRGYKISNVELAEHKNTGSEEFGILADYSILDDGGRELLYVREMKIPKKGTDICYWYGERYSDCRVIGRDADGRKIVRNFKAIGASLSLGLDIGQTRVEFLVREYSAGRAITQEEAVAIFDTMTRYRQ